MQKLLKKRMMAIILCVAMLFSIVPMNTVMASGVESDVTGNVQEEQVQEKVQSDRSIETDHQAVDELQLQYLYVKSPYLQTPDTQEIMVSFQEGVELSNALLVYQNEVTAEQYEIQAEELQGSAAVFSIDYLDDSLAGVYHLVKIEATAGDITQQLDLVEIGIDSRYGVNRECETQPDAVVEEEEENTSAGARTMSETGNATTFMTYDDSGELVESESAEDIVEESTEGLQTSKARTSAKAKNIVVVLDPGHGGDDSGAVGVNSVKEKDLTLKIAQYCKAELEQYGGVTVEMTRTGDTRVGGATTTSQDLANRVTYASGKGADVLVSIHLNSFNRAAYGAEVYYPNSNYRPDIGSQGGNLAQKVQNELISLGLYNRGVKISNSQNGSTYPDGSLQDYYALIWQSKRAGFPAIIVEHAFIDNVNDYNNYLSSDAKLQALGIADAKGIAAAYGLSKGKWEKDSQGWKFVYQDGTYEKNKWAYINGSWYYFDKTGYMETGWLELGGAKYYLDPVNGDMKIGWQLLDKKWYYFNGSGAMLTGWHWIGGKCYYFDGSGVMAADTWIGNDYVNASGAWVQGLVKPMWIQSGNLWWYRHSDGGYTRSNWEKISGEWYYFDANGWMQTGWQIVGGTWYYMDGSGKMQTGWLKLGANKYYLNASGAMLVGWQWIGDKCYYFNGSGAMATDTWIDDYYVDKDGVWVQGKVRSKWIQSGSLWWYRHADGSYTKSDWEEIDGQKYYFDANGWMQTGWQLIKGSWYYMNASGHMQTGWQIVGGTWYYMDGSGKMQTGWLKLGTNKYYLNASGVMLVGWQWIGDKCYYFSGSGVMASDTWIGNDYVDADGAWVPEKPMWIQSGNLWWYRHADGSYTRSNWEKINDQWYYFDANGWMQTGWIVAGNAWYYLNASGAMHKGWLDEGGQRYYLNPVSSAYGAEGSMAQGYRQLDGQWYYFNKGVSPVGALYHTGITPVMGTTSLGTDKETVVKKFVKMYMQSGRTYPSDALGKGGAANITQFCEILYEEAAAEGVKPEVVFGQAMNETGYLRFGGDVKVEQFNFAGLGATSGVPGNSFPDVRTGLRAQVQHLKAYASSDGLNQECVDNRFNYVTRNCAPYVEWLGQKENPSGKGWATGLRYGINLMKLYINPLYTL